MVRDEERAERITMLTDALLALVATGVAIPLLVEVRRGGGALVLAWGLVFLLTAAAAAAGGAFHGLRHRLRAPTADRLWRGTLFLTALVGFCLMAAAALTLPSSRVQTALLWLALAKLFTVLLMLRQKPAFSVVAVDSGLSLLVLGVAAAWGIARGGSYPGGGWVLAGVVLSLVGAAVQQRRWRHDRYFDHNDLFHLSQAAACLLFYQGVGQG